MSDLEKYYMLALWENYSVKYDGEFWPGGYDFDYYSHQWDAYGILEEHLGVCAGIAVTYANLCHAADLPCKFVRCDEYLDHTINYIPDINGNSYYIDVTENSFFMSADCDWSFEPLDLKFAGIDDKDRPSDGAFEYFEKHKYDDGLSRLPANIKDYYEGKTGEGEFKPASFATWFNEYCLRKNTDKNFVNDYEEKGSGDGTRHASYTEFDKYPAQPYTSRKGGVTNLWFLNDFYLEPETIKQKILGKEFDEQLLIIDGVNENYDFEEKDPDGFKEALEKTVKNNISIKYFPSLEKNGEIVSESDELKQDTDYEVEYTGYDEKTHEAILTIKAIEGGSYKGRSELRVKVNTAAVIKTPIRNSYLDYNGSAQELLKEPGKAENGEMQFAIGTKEKPTGEFSAQIPTATNAGTYYIWYKAAGNKTHYDSEPQRIVQPVVISPIDVSATANDVTIKVGEKFTLKPEVFPEVDVTLNYESSDEDIATVSADGAITGVGKGSTTIMIRVKLKNPDPNYSVNDGSLAVTVTAKDSKKDSQGKDAVSYKVVSGGSNVWYKGSKTTSDFTFRRSVDNASAIDHFTGISVDGKSVDAKNYIKESGSVIIRLKAAYLETLEPGSHTLKAEFDDGSAIAKFRIKTGVKGNIYKTGDDSRLLLWGVLMTISMFAVVSRMILYRRKN